MKDLAFAVLLAIPFWGPILGFVLQEQRVSDPEYIAVYELKRDPLKEPLLNLRVVIHATSEGEAVMKSTIFLQSKFGINATEALQFVEVAPRKEPKK